MQTSKINDLRSSTFRQLRQSPRSLQASMHLPLSSSNFPLSPSKISSLPSYQLSLSPCPFHNNPIKYLCLKPQCKSSTYAVCHEGECKKMHACPDNDFIQLKVFNDLVREQGVSIEELSGKVRMYFQEIKEQIVYRIGRNMERVMYLLEEVYIQEVPRLVRQKRNKDITSAKLSTFVQKQLSAHSSTRKRLESLRDKISDRISSRETAIQNFFSTKEFRNIFLTDLVNVEEYKVNQLVGRVGGIEQMGSSIVKEKDEIEVLMRMLRENRAPGFSRVRNIYKGSQSAFSSDGLRHSMNGIAPTLILIKSTLNRKFGAFLNAKLNSLQEWISDASGLSFLFSLDHQQSYRLKPEAHSRLKAAFGGSTGLQIGSGCDLYICDEANINRKNGANLGGSYRLPKHLQPNTPKARSYLAGQQLFLVQQIQVFCFQ